jgi:hypothetical protein
MTDLAAPNRPHGSGPSLPTADAAQQLPSPLSILRRLYLSSAPAGTLPPFAPKAQFSPQDFPPQAPSAPNL